VLLFVIFYGNISNLASRLSLFTLYHMA